MQSLSGEPDEQVHDEQVHGRDGRRDADATVGIVQILQPGLGFVRLMVRALSPGGTPERTLVPAQETRYPSCQSTVCLTHTPTWRTRSIAGLFSRKLRVECF